MPKRTWTRDKVAEMLLDAVPLRRMIPALRGAKVFDYLIFDIGERLVSVRVTAVREKLKRCKNPRCHKDFRVVLKRQDYCGDYCRESAKYQRWLERQKNGQSEITPESSEVPPKFAVNNPPGA